MRHTCRGTQAGSSAIGVRLFYRVLAANAVPLKVMSPLCSNGGMASGRHASTSQTTNDDKRQLHALAHPTLPILSRRGGRIWGIFAHPPRGQPPAPERRKRPASPPTPSRGVCDPLRTFITVEADSGETARNSTNIRRISGAVGRDFLCTVCPSRDPGTAAPPGTDQRCEHQVRHHARLAAPNLARSSNFSTFPAGFRGSTETISNR